jgi:hypothetical protein
MWVMKTVQKIKEVKTEEVISGNDTSENNITRPILISTLKTRRNIFLTLKTEKERSGKIRTIQTLEIKTKKQFVS